MLMILPDLEAREDLRQIMLIGASFGGKEAEQYVDHLQNMAWDAATATAGGKFFEAAEARKSKGI